MGLVLNLEAVGQVEPFLQLATDLHDAVLVVAVARPDSYLVALGTNVHNGTANVIEAVERLTNQAENCINPVTIQLWALVATQSDHPAAAILVRFVLPHRSDAFLEERVVAADLDFAGLLNVSEQRPEVFDVREC